jgi:hypothetical protein
MYPSAGAGNTGSSSTWQASSSTTAMNPYFTSFCRWPGIMVEGVQSCSTMAQGGREGNTLEVLVFFLFPSFSLSPLSAPLSFFKRMEGGRERTMDGAKLYRGAQGRSPALNPMASVVQWLGPLKHSKGIDKLSLPTSPTPRTSRQL